MTLNSLEPPRHRAGLHPAVGLVAGFVVIVLGATLVHVVFNLLI
jgi:hypothetical protein